MKPKESDLLEEEFWRPIQSLPRHQASNLGRIRYRGQVVKTMRDSYDHLFFYAKLKSYVTTRRVSRAVGEAFCCGYHPKAKIEYVDGDKGNCRPANLRWILPKKKEAKSKRKATFYRNTKSIPKPVKNKEPRISDRTREKLECLTGLEWSLIQKLYEKAGVPVRSWHKDPTFKPVIEAMRSGGFYAESTLDMDIMSSARNTVVRFYSNLKEEHDNKQRIRTSI